MNYLQAISILLLFSCNTANTGKQIKEESKLVGAWKAVADQEIDSNYNVARQDTNISGLIIYNADGKMSAQIIWKAVRSSIMNDSIMQKDGAATAVLALGTNIWTVEELRKLVDTYDAYFGDYLIDTTTNTVTHIVTGNLRPEKDGTTYKRIYKLKGDSLFLRSADPASRWQMAWIRTK